LNPASVIGNLLGGGHAIPHGTGANRRTGEPTGGVA
jgi:hypothetical protein